MRAKKSAPKALIPVGSRAYFRKREREIRNAYDNAYHDLADAEEDDDDGDDDGQAVAGRRRKRAKPLVLIPYKRPREVIKRLAYRLAIVVRDNNRIDELIEYVLKRDSAFEPHGKRAKHVTEWALRFVVVTGPPSKKGGSPKTRSGEVPVKRDSEFLIKSSQISKYSMELQLAYDLDIDWRNLTHFIAAIGGSDYIHKNRVPVDLASQEWVRLLKRRRTKTPIQKT